MNILIYLACILSRYVELEPYNNLSMKMNVEKDVMFKFIYNTFGSKKVEVLLYDNMHRLITLSKKTSGIIYVNPSITGRFEVLIKNNNKEKIKFGYRSPNVNKEVQGSLGPIQDEDAVSELLSVLENNIKSQKRQLEKHENHFKLVKKSKSWIFYFVIFEIFTSLAMMYYLHKNTLKMFEKKHVGK